jgi:hypothetical protein
MLKALLIWVIMLVAAAFDNLSGLVFAPKYTWNFVFDGAEAKLAYGRPNSDEVGLMMTCAPKSGLVVVSGDVDAQAPRMTLVSGSASTRLSGTAEPDPLSGGTWFEAHAPLRQGALREFARTGSLSLVRGDRRTSMTAGRDEREAVGRFFQACA